MRVVVGLRNPGPDYAGTRHNVGYEVVNRLAERSDVRLGRAPSRVKGLAAQAGVGEEKVLLFVPNTYMNRSGGPVRAISDYYNVPSEHLLVVHDDIDLPFGRLRLQVGGGSGGHNGIRSIEASLGTKYFSRLKFGVGRPPGDMDPADYVLKRFKNHERTEVDAMIEDAAEVIELWLTDPPRAQEMAALRDRNKGLS